MSEREATGGRRGTGRRRSATAESAPAPARSRAYRRLINPYDHPRIYSDDQVAAIHAAALTMLENQGMKVLSAIAAPAIRADAGATVDEETQVVRIDRGLVAEGARDDARASSPSGRRIRTSNVTVGGRNVCFAPTSGPPNIMDIHGGRRAGTLEDFCNLDQAVPVASTSCTRSVARSSRRTARCTCAISRPRARCAAVVRQSTVPLRARLAADRGLPSN